MIRALLGRKGPVLEGEGLRLRLPRRSDYVPWQTLRARNRDYLRPFEPKWSDLDLTRKSFENRVRHCAETASSGKELGLLIFSLQEQESGRAREMLVGGITLSNIRYHAARQANIGYWLGRDQMGRGYMSRAIRLVASHAFETLGLNRLNAACLPDNEPSRKVLLNSGFVKEGFASEYLQINGEFRGHLLFGLTATRHAAIKGNSSTSL